jgi:CheY-like chemotaxis protein
MMTYRHCPGQRRLRRLAIVLQELPSSTGDADGLALLLRLLGHEVRVVHDGPAALELLTGYRPEMVFLDIGMPGMDGCEVARRVRQMPGMEGVRLAALTGWGQQEDRRHPAEAGFHHHLVKPVEPKVLEKRLAESKPARVL